MSYLQLSGDKVNKCVCNVCKSEFEIEIKKREQDDIQETYFTCAICKKEYLILRTNSEIRKLINENLNLKIRLKRNLSIPYSKRLQNRYKSNLEKLEELEKNLLNVPIYLSGTND